MLHARSHKSCILHLPTITESKFLHLRPESQAYRSLSLSSLALISPSSLSNRQLSMNTRFRIRNALTMRSPLKIKMDLKNLKICSSHRASSPLPQDCANNLSMSFSQSMTAINSRMTTRSTHPLLFQIRSQS